MGNCNFPQNIPADDHKVAISSADTAANYLENKLVAGTNVTLTKQNTGGNENIKIDVPSSLEDHKVLDTAADTTPGFLNSKIIAGIAMSSTIINPGANEIIRLDNPYPETFASRVSSGDTTPAFLESKIIAGTGITVTKENAGGNEDLKIACTIAAEDHKVDATATDTTPGFLGSKITAGTGIALSLINPGANENIMITNVATEDHKVSISAADTTPNYLENKLVAGTNITLTKQNTGANENILITAAGSSAIPRMSNFLNPVDFVLQSGSPTYASNSSDGSGGFVKKIQTWEIPDGASIAAAFAAGANMDFTKDIKIRIYWTPSTNNLNYDKDMRARIQVLGNACLVDQAFGGFTNFQSHVGGDGWNGFYISNLTIIPPYDFNPAGMAPSDFWWIEFGNYHETGHVANSIVFQGMMIEYGVT